jgi:hypothetical protein
LKGGSWQGKAKIIKYAELTFAEDIIDEQLLLLCFARALSSFTIDKLGCVHYEIDPFSSSRRL